MELFIKLLIQGVGTGMLFAIIGLSFGLINNITRVFHFAHGAVITIAGYVVYFAMTKGGAPLIVAAPIAALVCAVAGTACELAIYRPLRARGAPLLLMFLASFAVLVIAQNALFLAFDGVPVTLPAAPRQSVSVFGVAIAQIVFWKIAAGVAVIAATAAFLRYTRMGKEMRAVVSNPEMARSIGIDVNRVYIWAYAIGSALTTPVAIIALYDQGVSPDMGEALLLIATIAVFSGGVGILLAGALGGFVLGLISSLAALWLNAALQQTIALALLTFFLLWRPAGFLGLRLRRV